MIIYRPLGFRGTACMLCATSNRHNQKPCGAEVHSLVINANI